MITRVTRIGYAMVVVGVVLLSPITDLLPVGVFESMKTLIGINPAGPFRVIPSEQSTTIEVIFIAVGLLFIVAGWLHRSTKRKE